MASLAQAMAPLVQAMASPPETMAGRVQAMASLKRKMIGLIATITSQGSALAFEGEKLNVLVFFALL